MSCRPANNVTAGHFIANDFHVGVWKLTMHAGNVQNSHCASSFLFYVPKCIETTGGKAMLSSFLRLEPCRNIPAAIHQIHVALPMDLASTVYRVDETMSRLCDLLTYYSLITAKKCN